MYYVSKFNHLEIKQLEFATQRFNRCQFESQVCTKKKSFYYNCFSILCRSQNNNHTQDLNKKHYFKLENRTQILFHLLNINIHVLTHNRRKKGRRNSLTVTIYLCVRALARGDSRLQYCCSNNLSHFMIPHTLIKRPPLNRLNRYTPRHTVCRRTAVVNNY